MASLWSLIKPFHVLETADSDASVETGVNSKMLKTISGGRISRGSATGEAAFIFEKKSIYGSVVEDVAAGFSRLIILLLHGIRVLSHRLWIKLLRGPDHWRWQKTKKDSTACGDCFNLDALLRMDIPHE